jgi:predicted HicB family RNase H-like nuclease
VVRGNGEAVYRLGLRLPRELGKQIKYAALDADVSVTEWVIRAIKNELDREANR